MRILVTGGRGFVAGAILAQAPANIELHALSTGDRFEMLPHSIQWHKIDLFDKYVLNNTLDAIRPDVVIHTAAVAGIDACEADRNKALAVNVEYTRELASYVERTHKRLVYLSTDNVFDGTLALSDPPYSETAKPAPVNWYGETKYRAEQAVAAMVSPWVVARVALVMGLPLFGDGNAFLSWMIPKWKAGLSVGVPPDEVRTPIDVITLGSACLELALGDYAGFIHLAGNDRLDRLTLVRRIASVLGYDPCLVHANNPVNLPNRAPRPCDVSMDNSHARAILKTPFPELEDAVKLCFQAANKQINK